MFDVYGMHPLLAMVPGLRLVQVTFAVGATGAVGTVTGGEGLKTSTPVLRNGVGDYSFRFNAGSGAAELISCDAFAVGALDATAGTRSKCISNAVASTTAPLIRMQFMRPDTGAAAEVANGDSVKFWALLRTI